MSAALRSIYRNHIALIAAIAKITQTTKVDRVLLQPMVSGLGEALIGYRLDPDVGPLVMLASGGILAEIHRDRSLRLAPVDLAAGEAMISEVAALQRSPAIVASPRATWTRWRRPWWRYRSSPFGTARR